MTLSSLGLNMQKWKNFTTKVGPIWPYNVHVFLIFENLLLNSQTNFRKIKCVALIFIKPSIEIVGFMAPWSHV